MPWISECLESAWNQEESEGLSVTVFPRSSPRIKVYFPTDVGSGNSGCVHPDPTTSISWHPRCRRLLNRNITVLALLPVFRAWCFQVGHRTMNGALYTRNVFRYSADIQSLDRHDVSGRTMNTSYTSVMYPDTYLNNEYWLYGRDVSGYVIQW